MSKWKSMPEEATEEMLRAAYFQHGIETCKMSLDEVEKLWEEDKTER